MGGGHTGTHKVEAVSGIPGYRVVEGILRASIFNI